jgi:hypothetical protein
MNFIRMNTWFSLTRLLINRYSGLLVNTRSLNSVLEVGFVNISKIPDAMALMLFMHSA